MEEWAPIPDEKTVEEEEDITIETTREAASKNKEGIYDPFKATVRQRILITQRYHDVCTGKIIKEEECPEADVHREQR